MFFTILLTSKDNIISYSDKNSRNTILKELWVQQTFTLWYMLQPGAFIRVHKPMRLYPWLF